MLEELFDAFHAGGLVVGAVDNGDVVVEAASGHAFEVPHASFAGARALAAVDVSDGSVTEVREMIDDADERLDIMNPYLTDGDIIDRIAAAAERGVDVRIVVSEKSNNFAAQMASEHHYPRLLDAGVEIWEYPGAVVHAKLVVADDLVHFGTLNLDAWALYRDFEVAMLADSPEVAAAFEERVFGPDIAISNAASKPGGVQRLVNWTFARFTWFL